MYKSLLVVLMTANIFGNTAQASDITDIMYELAPTASLQAKSDEQNILSGVRTSLLDKDYPAAKEKLKALQGTVQSHDAFTQAKFYFYQAEVARADNDIEAALKAYDTALQIDKHPSILMGYASLLLSEKNMLAFAEVVDTLVQLQPNHPRVKYYQAVELLQQDKLDEAKVVLEASKAAFPDFLPTRIVLARIYYEQNLVELADKALAEVTRQQQYSLLTAKLAAGIKLRLYEPNAAIKILQPFIASYTHDKGLNSLYVNALMRLKSFKEGIKTINDTSLAATNHAVMPSDISLASIYGRIGNKEFRVLEGLTLEQSEQAQPTQLKIIHHLHQNQTSAALNLAKEWVATAGENAQAHNSLALCLWANGQPIEAEKALLQALSFEHDNIDIINNLASLYLDTSQSDKAKRYLEQASLINQHHARTLVLLSQYAQSQGQAIQARAWLKKAKHHNPNVSSVGLHILSFYLQNNDPGRALEEAKLLAAKFSDDVRVINVLAELHYRLGNYFDAIETYQKLQKLIPNKAFVYVGIAKSSLGVNNIMAAKNAIHKSLKINPAYYPALALKGYIAYEEKDFHLAEKIANKLILSQPDADYGYKLKGLLADAQNNNDKALTAFIKAYQLDQNVGNVKNAYGAFRKSGKHGKGFALLESWLRVYPTSASIRRLLATDYLQARRYKKAQYHFEKILSQKPNDAIVLNNLANIYMHKDSKLALEYAHRAYRLVPDHPRIADTFAWALIQRGKAKKGLPILAKVLKTSPEINEARLHYAYGLHELGQHSQAQLELDKLGKLPAEHQRVYYDLKQKLKD